MHGSEVTSPNSSTANTLIPVLSIFFVMAIFLGLTYKVNNKELKNIMFKIYSRDSLYLIIKKYIIYLPFLY
ncbi:CIR protein PIR protein, fragment [Plasmodium vinckei lentum]|uniref:CIR protein PIR protein n=1 Tax=Plasmodium vinckei lentum TaxID=138297 RepID=A0A6V7S368_PLAVN|nr:CIR protein PIR protein, fragment [Plasmodium vinckei lentum]